MNYIVQGNDYDKKWDYIKNTIKELSDIDVDKIPVIELVLKNADHTRKYNVTVKYNEVCLIFSLMFKVNHDYTIISLLLNTIDKNNLVTNYFSDKIKYRVIVFRNLELYSRNALHIILIYIKNNIENNINIKVILDTQYFPPKEFVSYCIIQKFNNLQKNIKLKWQLKVTEIIKILIKKEKVNTSAIISSMNDIKELLLDIWITNISYTMFFKELMNQFSSLKELSDKKKILILDIIQKSEHFLALANYSDIIHLQNTLLEIHSLFIKQK